MPAATAAASSRPTRPTLSRRMSQLPAVHQDICWPRLVSSEHTPAGHFAAHDRAVAQIQSLLDPHLSPSLQTATCAPSNKSLNRSPTYRCSRPSGLTVAASLVPPVHLQHPSAHAGGPLSRLPPTPSPQSMRKPPRAMPPSTSCLSWPSSDSRPRRRRQPCPGLFWDGQGYPG